MSKRSGVDQESLRKLMAKLGKLGPAAEEAMKEALSRGGDTLRDAAKANAPVKTGKLRDSIESAVSDGGRSATIGTDVPYGAAVELGTANMDAQPYLFPAFESEKAGILKDMAATVDKANRRTARR